MRGTRDRRSRVSMSKILESIGNAVHHVHDNAHDLAAVTKSVAEEKLLDIPYVDLTIQVGQAKRICRGS
jgi:hypothetical protein